MRRLLFFVVSCMVMLQVVASERDSAYVNRYSLWRGTTDVALGNPAFMTRAYMKSDTQLGVRCDYRHQSDAFRLEDGTGMVLPGIFANTYIRLTKSSVVWGEASYSNGKHWDRVYNSVADFDLLYPYVIADSVGGDTHRERYFFSGGYAAERGRWQMGGVLKLRAEQEYRTYDPRMRSVVYDVSLTAGAAVAVGGYRLGLSAEGNIYRQTADVDFYSEMNGMGELQMTGLGTDYVRFSGSNRDIFYKGKGGTLAFDVLPSGDKGWLLHLRHGINEYVRLLDEYNSMPLTTLYRQRSALTAGWKGVARGTERALLVHAVYDRRAGDEHVAGTASGQEYPVLTDLTMYHEHRIDVGATAFYGRGDWHLALKAGYLSKRERYEYVERRMDYGRLYGEVTAQWLKRLRKDLCLNVCGKGGYQGKISDRIVMPYANMTSGRRDYINHNYRYHRASYAHVDVGIRADFRPAKWRVGLFGQVATAWKFCTEGEHEAGVRAAVGVVL